LEPLSQITIIVTGAAALTLIFYYIGVMGRLALYKEKSPTTEQLKPASVIVCARNEEYNLKQFLPLVLNQDYPDYEVIVIDDASWDGTDEILYKLAIEHKRLSIITIDASQKTRDGKKFALTLGIKRAKHETLVMIDADCRPASTIWLKSMCKGMDDGIGLGYGAYEMKPGLLNLLIRYDTWSSAILYLSAALCGRAYMGVGRNLTYSKSVYKAQGGFRHHYQVASGDDDLLVNHAKGKFPVSISVKPESHTISIASSNWADWFKQKRRHMSVASLYTSSSKMFLGLYYSAQILFYLGLLVGMLCGAWKLTLLIWCVKTLIHLLISHGAGYQLKEKSLLVLLPVLEPLLLLIQIVSGVMMKVKRTSSWK